MAEQETIEISVDHAAGNRTRTSTGGMGRTTVDQLPESGVRFLLAAMEQNGADIDIPVFADSEDAWELSDDHLEAFDLPEGTNFSVESLLDVEVSRPYVGDVTFPQGHDDRWSDEQLEEAGSEENAEDSDDFSPQKLSDTVENDQIDRHTKIDIGKSLNGHYRESVEGRFGADGHISVGVGATSEHDDPYERATFMRFRYTEGKTSDYTKARAMYDCELWEKEQFVEWCEDNGYDDKV